MTLFYKKKRTYHRISDVKEDMAFGVERENRRFFLSFASITEFSTWYDTLKPNEKTLNEIVRSDHRKLILDIDTPSPDSMPADELWLLKDFYDFERHVVSRIREVFYLLQIGKPDVIVYDMCSDNKLSYHVVVSNFAFSARTCRGLCSIISSGQVWERCVDAGVYKTLQSIRIEGSTKFGEHRWKNRVIDGAIQNIVNIETGLLSCLEHAKVSDFACDIVTVPFSEINNSRFVMSDCFKVRKTCGDTVFLRRVKPGFCCQCNRVHFKENAMVKQTTFVCWRFFATHRT